MHIAEVQVPTGILTLCWAFTKSPCPGKPSLFLRAVGCPPHSLGIITISFWVNIWQWQLHHPWSQSPKVVSDISVSISQDDQALFNGRVCELLGCNIKCVVQSNQQLHIDFNVLSSFMHLYVLQVVSHCNSWLATNACRHLDACPLLKSPQHWFLSVTESMQPPIYMERITDTKYQHMTNPKIFSWAEALIKINKSKDVRITHINVSGLFFQSTSLKTKKTF